jgi:hypothetical protein
VLTIHDVCAIFPATKVMEIATKYQAKFQERMEQYFSYVNKKYFEINTKEKDIITSSCGVVIAKAKTPISYMFGLSIELQKKAKKKRKEYFDTLKKENNEKIKRGFIDFQNIGREGTVDIDKFREKIKGLYRRPYMVVGNTDEIKEKGIEHLVELINELKRTKFPKTKTRQFYNLVRDSYENMKDYSIKYDLINFIARLEEKHREILKECFEIGIEEKEDIRDIKIKFDNIFDILELYSFAGGEENNDN